MAGDFVLDAGYWRNVERAGNRARKDVLDAIADDSRRLVPVDTGELRNSIKVRPVLGRVEVGTDHWLFVEYGTRFMDAQPFIRPALFRERGA